MRLIRIMLTTLIALFCPLAALTVVFLPPVTAALADANVGGATPTEHASLVEVAAAVRNYSFDANATVPTGSDYRTALTPDALSHLDDVRMVFIAAELGFTLVALALIVLAVIAVRRQGLAVLVRPLCVGAVVPLAGALALGGAVALNFDAFFTWMHGLFFAAESWTFPADSLLIRALPQGFWVGCAALWVVLMVLLCALSMAAGLFLGRQARARLALGNGTSTVTGTGAGSGTSVSIGTNVSTSTGQRGTG